MNDMKLLKKQQKECISDGFINKRYIKCPLTSNKCKWKMESKHRKGYEYLNNACYLSGSFNLECPK